MINVIDFASAIQASLRDNQKYLKRSIVEKKSNIHYAISIYELSLFFYMPCAGI